MRTLYIECSMGAAGDMLMAALYELLDEGQKQRFVEKMNGLGLPGVKVTPRAKKTCGIMGTHMEVTVRGEEEREPAAVYEEPQEHHGHGEHHPHGVYHRHGHHSHEHDPEQMHAHASPGQIAELIGTLPLPESVRTHARQVYDLIAEAEAKAHGCPVGDVHFHEVGALDAVADVAGVCCALEMLSPDQILASPVHVGSGTVRCAHGVMPVPAPATANLLADVPIYGGAIKGELCTPTGAALLVHFAKEFGDMPIMRGTSVGIGIGTKEFDAANCVRIFLGDTEEWSLSVPIQNMEESADECAEANGSIAELVCNIDDMTPEALAYAQTRILEKGALDVYAVAGTMKKGRPGWELTVLCGLDRIDETAKNILRETTTNGVRVRICRKYFLKPGSRSVLTSCGMIRLKTAEGFGITHVKPEFRDVAQAASASNVSYRAVYEETLRRYSTEYRKGKNEND